MIDHFFFFLFTHSSSLCFFFFFSSRRRHTRFDCDWSSDVCSSDLDLADTFQWERAVKPSRGGFGLVVKEPVGVVGAIIPWNAPMGLISMKLAPALIAGCTVILKTSPEAPGEGYIISEAAE